MIVTRYIADNIYDKKYNTLMGAYYGSLTLVVPIAAVIAFIFLLFVDASLSYKICAYIFFIELVVIWMQNVFMSALKDYRRIFISFTVAIVISIVASLLLYHFTELVPVVVALLGMNIGFASILISASFHFEHVFPRGPKRHYFAFLKVLPRYPSIVLSGVFVYTSVYVHNIIYWLFSPQKSEIAGQFYLMPFYDVAVFFAYLTVLPSLNFFVVIIETDFYEQFVNYYDNVIKGGTFESV